MTNAKPRIDTYPSRKDPIFLSLMYACLTLVFFSLPNAHELNIHERRQYCGSENARYYDKMACDGCLRLELNVIVAHRAPLSSIFAPLVLSSMCSRMSRLIKVRDVIVMSKRVITWSHSPMGRLMTKRVTPWTLLTTMRSALFMW
jgi:hypothetical protein